MTTFYGVAIGSTITLSNYTLAQLTNAMAGSNLANVEFSVCCGNYSPSTNISSNYPAGTLWVTFTSPDTNPSPRPTPALLPVP